MNKIHITYEYSNGKEGVKFFPTLDAAYEWINGEGDHLIDYTLYFS